MDLFEQAVERTVKLFEQGVPVVVACSFGKDSSVVLAIALEAAIRTKANGFSPYMVITHGDTDIENPAMRSYADKEIERVNAFKDKHGIEVAVRVSHPSLNDGWAVRVISGRALPSFPGSTSDCSVSWKVLPMERMVKEIFAGIKERFNMEPVTLIGTRFEESAQRFRAMTERGESWEVPVRGERGNLVLSVIANWEEFDVWEAIGEVMNGRITTYSDFKELYSIYQNGGGGGCVISFAEIGKENGEANKKAGGCGARFGCAICTRVKNDKSLMSMIELDPDRYGFMRGINEMREYLINTRWDMDRRMWIGRSIINGAIAIQPDSYSPAFCLELLRICLTLDALEIESSAKLGIDPRFTLISKKSLIVIDATWSLQGYAKPFQAIREWHEVMEQGKRYGIPKTAEFKRKAMPETRYIYVGRDWDNGEFYGAGLHSTAADIYTEPGWGGGCMGHGTVLGTTKNVTNYFFSEKYSTMSEMPAESVLGVPSMEEIILVGNDYPDLHTKMARGKAEKMISLVKAGDMDGVLIPSKKLSKQQKAMAKSVGDSQSDESENISVMRVNFSDEIEVDLQSAEDVLSCFMDELLQKNAMASDSSGLTEGYRWWLQMGTLSVSVSQLRKIDTVLRRTCFKERNGLAGASYSQSDAIKNSMSKKEFFELATKNIPSEDDKRKQRLAEMEWKQQKLRSELQQKRVSLAELHKEWSPEVNWMRVLQSKQLASSRIPRRHHRNGYLVLRHFVSRSKLAEFIANNETIKEAVRKHRCKKSRHLAVKQEANVKSFVLGGKVYVQDDLFADFRLAA
jgi:DNA sulfur modification protein DndC